MSGIATQAADAVDAVDKAKSKEPMSYMMKCALVIVVVILAVVLFVMFFSEHLAQKSIVDLADIPKQLFSNWNLTDGSGKVITFTYANVTLTPKQKALIKGNEVRSDVLRDTLMAYAKKQKLLSRDGKFVKLDPVLAGALGVNDKQIKVDRIQNLANKMMIVYKLPGGKTESTLVKFKRAFVNTQNGNVNVLFDQEAERKTLRYVLKNGVLYSVGVGCAITNPNCAVAIAKRA